MTSRNWRLTRWMVKTFSTGKQMMMASRSSVVLRTAFRVASSVWLLVLRTLRLAVSLADDLGFWCWLVSQAIR